MGVAGKNRLFALAFTLAAVLLAWFSLSELLTVAVAMGRGDPLIVVWPRAVLGLPGAVMFLAFAAMSGYPTLKTRAGRDVPTLCMIIALCCVPLVLVSSPLFGFVLGWKLERQGYHVCPPVAFERPTKRRWAEPLAGDPLGRCPASS